MLETTGCHHVPDYRYLGSSAYLGKHINDHLGGFQAALLVVMAYEPL